MSLLPSILLILCCLLLLLLCTTTIGIIIISSALNLPCMFLPKISLYLWFVPNTATTVVLLILPLLIKKYNGDHENCCAILVNVHFSYHLSSYYFCSYFSILSSIVPFLPCCRHCNYFLIFIFIIQLC